MKSWITLPTSNKISNFSDLYCVSSAVTNIILYIVSQLENGGIISFYI